MLSKAASMVAGVLIAHFYSDGFFPASHAAWSWECTYYTGGDIKAPVYMAVNATDGPTCADDSKLTCSCPSNPCKGPAAALPSNLVCAGAGNDAATSGCFKLHHTYGTPAHAAVAGRGAADQVSDACGAADIIKVYGNAAGLDTMVSWGALTADIIDNSTQPLSAQACQTLCAGNADCKFFTFNDQGASGGNYMYFRGLCVLHKALACNGTQYSTFHGAIAGPSACPDGVTVPPAATPAPAPAPTPATGSADAKDIVDTAVAAGSFTVLAELLTKADLVTTLQGTGPFTVFAPHDDAFAFSFEAMGMTKEDVLKLPNLKDILKYHVVSGSVKRGDLTNGMKPATVNGETVTITIDGTTVKVNTAKVVAADVMCSNGVIHIIDSVLMPPADSSAPEPAPSPASTTQAASTATDASTAYNSQRLAVLTFGAILSAFLFA